ncbi:Hypothetical protein PBC10988_23580 [Planctomycetales bacterium 10988]|nr:Hypothetical protein PBC10988_23580 [Planctomycetales bacterium 10988]
MKIAFCIDDIEEQAVDTLFQEEADAAQQLGIRYELVDFEAIRKREPLRAARFIKAEDKPVPTLYRGWMLTPTEYQTLDEALQLKNHFLITSPKAYQLCHWFPENYEIIRRVTPESVWISFSDQRPSHEEIHQHLKELRDSGLIVKDYVKSQKHYWEEACYIPKASDREQVEHVVDRFLELQGDDLQGGLVFRKAVELEPLGCPLPGKFPQSVEYRIFVFHGDVVATTPTWNSDYPKEKPPVHEFLPYLRSIDSPFFSCDLALQTDGKWIIVEIGDGQVSGLPDSCKVTEFYQSIQKRWESVERAT